MEHTAGVGSFEDGRESSNFTNAPSIRMATDIAKSEVVLADGYGER